MAGLHLSGVVLSGSQHEASLKESDHLQALQCGMN